LKVEVDVPTVARGQSELHPVETDEEIEAHYTEIIISKLHRNIQGRTKRKIKDYLRSMYRCDLEDGIELMVEGESLKWDGFQDEILQDTDGKPFRKDILIEVCGKPVTGWVAVLKSGGRPFGGFSILQSRRVIRGNPDAWRPSTIFGQEGGTNDLINQRVCGEMTLDGFQVNHTKDGINWQGEEEEVVEKLLKEECAEYVSVARKHRKGDKRGPSAVAIANAVSTVTTELQSDEMVDAIEIAEIPTEGALKETNKAAIEHAARGKPKIDVVLGGISIKFYIDEDADPNSPYYVLDPKADGAIEIAINKNHPYMVQLGDQIEDFIRQAVYDGIAEYKALMKKGKVEPHTIRFLKDNLLRVPYLIREELQEDEEGAAEEIVN
jgi:hypothetical protein